jgi:hypothetical protein
MIVSLIYYIIYPDMSHYYRLFQAEDNTSDVEGETGISSCSPPSHNLSYKRKLLIKLYFNRKKHKLRKLAL